jgi:hypothetical protein
MLAELALVPPFAFLLFLLIVVVIDRVGSVIADDRTGEGEYQAAYACGEDIPGGRIKPRYHRYHVGIGFTIIHIAVLLVATMPLDASGVVLGIPLLAVVGISLFALLNPDHQPQAGR